MTHSIATRNLVAHRRAQPDSGLARSLLELASVMERLAGVKLEYAGWPPRRIQLSELGLASHVSSVRRAWQAGRPEIISLADHAREPNYSIVVRDAVDASNDQSIVMSWPDSGALLQMEPAMQWLSELGSAFQADIAAIEDERLTALYRGQHIAEKVLTNVPEHLRQYVPPPLEVPDAAGALPELLLPTDINQRRVPDAVYWLNLWSGVHVDTLGRALVLGAPWAHIVEQPAGAVLLAATVQPTDPANAAHLQALRAIVAHLDLRAVQERERA